MSDKREGGKYQFLVERDTLEGLHVIPTYLKISQILLLQYDQFVNLINKFNEKLKVFTEDEPDYIEFSIVPNSDTTMLWKFFVHINCSRISKADQMSKDKIVLSLNQFLSVYESLSQQLLVLEKYPSDQLYNSKTQPIYPSFSTGKLNFPSLDTNECCICMDNQSDLVLPCTHKMCDHCVKEWSNQTAVRGRSTCPICRSDMNINDGFVLAEKLESAIVKKTIIKSIIEATDHYNKN